MGEVLSLKRRRNNAFLLVARIRFTRPHPPYLYFLCVIRIGVAFRLEIKHKNRLFKRQTLVMSPRHGDLFTGCDRYPIRTTL